MTNQQPQYVLSGLRPTGRVHLGNYFGAVRNWVGLQDRYAAAWAEAMGPAYSVMVASDQLHLTDASYGCLANALADGLALAMATPAPPQPRVTTRSTSSITMSARVPLSQPR